MNEDTRLKIIFTIIGLLVSIPVIIGFGVREYGNFSSFVLLGQRGGLTAYLSFAWLFWTFIVFYIIYREIIYSGVDNFKNKMINGFAVSLVLLLLASWSYRVGTASFFCNNSESHCMAQIEVDRKYEGRRVICPRCKHPTLIFGFDNSDSFRIENFPDNSLISSSLVEEIKSHY